MRDYDLPDDEDIAYQEVLRSVYVGERLRRELQDGLSPMAIYIDQTVKTASEALLKLAIVDLKSDHAYALQRDVQVCFHALSILKRVLNTSEKDSDLLDDEENFQVRKLVGEREVNDL